MDKVWRKGLPFSAEVAPLLAAMPLLDEYREPLVRLQGAWDSLTLLGQMSGAATDMADTRDAFQALTGQLLDSLARRQLHNLVQQLQGRAQVAIDILVRNLFERTADVGFLAADGPLRELLQAHARGDLGPDQREALRRRFAAYVAKYSVYDQVVLLSEQGECLAALDPSCCAAQVADPRLLQALEPGQAYVELTGPSPLLGGRPGLIYACAVRPEGEGVAARPGLLCLSFRLDDEMQALFAALAQGLPQAVLVLKDEQGRVLQSSDPWQLPLGAPLADAHAAQGWRLSFAGRDYLAVGASARPYEGYAGPGWRAQVLLPLAHAFADAASPVASSGTRGLDTRELFDAELRSIPLQARRIQQDLSRSLWNGKLRSRAHADELRGGSEFAITLLNEVERTGEQLRQVFERAIAQLEQGALAAVDQVARFQAELAMSLVDRNLYERANDCRWWALDARLQQALAEGRPELATRVLAQTHALYTVYALLLVFDARGQVVAVSDPAQAHQVGRPLQGDWVQATLSLQNAEQYAVSAFEPSGLYGEDGHAPGLVYAAAIRGEGGHGPVLGGIALVFDGQPQFAAMLRAALPSGQPGAQALLLNRQGEVLASSASRWAVGARAPLPQAVLAALAAGEVVGGELELDGCVHAYGLALSGGYREYRRAASPQPQDHAALLLLPLGPRLANTAADAAGTRFRALPPQGGEVLDVASFMVDQQWLGLPAEQVLAALESQRITAWPQAPAAVLGMLSHQGRMLPVLDLGRLLFNKPCGEEAALLVCQTRSGRALVLAVQGLGQVFSTSAQQLQPSPTRPAWAQAQQPPRLLKGQDAQMLTLLDADELWRVLGGAMASGLLLAG